MEQPGPATDKNMMKGSEVQSVSEELQPVNMANTDEEEQISCNSAHRAEICSQAKELVCELIETMADVEAEQEARPCSLEKLNGSKPATGTSEATGSERSGLIVLNVACGALVTPVANLGVVETSPSVLEGAIDTALTFDDPATPSSHEQSSFLISNCSTEHSPVEDSGPCESSSSSSAQSTSKNSPSNSTTTSGICNGPSTPSSDTLSSSLASSPQTSAKNSGPSHSLTSLYDTDCSRKLISQIQRSLSQESLLDELESELLDCQLPEGESGGESPPLNGLAAHQEGSMVIFEKCVQYKYAQQEKAIQR